MIKATLSRARSLVRLATLPSARAERRRRKAYDELFNSVQSGVVVVAAPELGGSFEIDCRSHLLKRLLVERSYESDIVDTIKRRIDPNRDAIDVGANVGFFTVLMASLVSGSNRVLAIEPTPGALAHLKQNIARNSSSNVVVFEGAAAERAGEFPIHVIAGMEEYSSMGEMVHPSITGRSHGETMVAGETLDGLVASLGLRPGLIKIDAEGAESRVLAGCERTMQIHRPVILCEAWPDSLQMASGGGLVGELLRTRGYEWEGCGSGEILAFPK